MSSAGATSAAIVSKMKETFTEHGVPDVLRSDNRPQYASAAFTEFTEEWGFQYTTSSPHYPASNAFTESMVKIIKAAFTKAKYSGIDPQLALLALHSTLVDGHLLSPGSLLYQWKLKTRLPTQSSNTDPQADEHHEHLEDIADHAKMTHDWNACTLLPLFAGQTVSILDTSRGIWIPGTVMFWLQQRSYLVCTTAGAVYCQTWAHLQDREVKNLTLSLPQWETPLMSPTRIKRIKSIYMHHMHHTCYMHQLLNNPNW